MNHGRFWNETVLGLFGVLGVFAAFVMTTVLFTDDFSTGVNQLDVSKWTTEFYSQVDNPAFIGRTALRDWVDRPGTEPFEVANGFAELRIDTYIPPPGLANNNAFLGTHAKTNDSYLPTATTDIVLTGRVRIRGTSDLQSGIVYALYFFDRGTCGSNTSNCHHDELDIELVTKSLLLPTPAVHLNHYASESLGGGHGLVVTLPAGFDRTGFHEWKIRWGLGVVRFYVDAVLLAAVTDHLPQGQMQATIEAWVPGSDWSAAYDGSFSGDTTAATNHRYVAYADWVVVASAPASFTDITLDATTPIRAVHVSELRSRIDSIRNARGKIGYAWHDDPITPGVTLISGQHILDLRTALGEVYVAAGFASPSYTDSTLTTGQTVVRAIHISELRDAILAIE